MSKSNKKIGDQVIITKGLHKGKVGVLQGRSQRGWLVELESGDVVDLMFPFVRLRVKKSKADKISSGMTVIELRKLAKEKGVSIARTKDDFLRIIKEMNPDEDLEQLKGKILIDRVSELHISRLRSKEDLQRLLSKK